MNVRVRYAPSPTGFQHIGGARTALFNYFFACSRGGTFILRIEDTDRERFSEEGLHDIYETLQWLGLDWDEGPDRDGEFGPYIQSERSALYKEQAERLLEAGHAYRCYCTAERLEKVRERQSKEKNSFQGYDRHCRDLSEEERSRLEKEGRSSVIRFKVPLDGTTEFEDVLLGRVKRKNKDINPDPVLLKSDGFPTYHLANVVDDHFMNISHILRAQEWLSSGPLHVLLYNAFGWTPPAYCHLPMVMGKDGQKLSKRHGATSVRDFKKAGYLPEAVINYVSLVGWSYDDKRQFFTKEELEELFTLDKLNKSPGVFDYKKLDWFNGQYIRQKSDDEVRELVLPYLKEARIVNDPPTPDEDKTIQGMVPLIKERMKTLCESVELSRFLFREVEEYDINEIIPKKVSTEKTLEIAEALAEFLDGFEQRTDETNEEIVRELAEKVDVKLGSLFMPLRVAVTGSPVSPPLFKAIRLLGVKKAKKRLGRVIELLRESLSK